MADANMTAEEQMKKRKQDKIDALIKRVEELKAQRSNWDNLWQTILDYVNPRKNTVIVQRSEGEDRNFQVYDNTGIQSNELLAGALHSFLTNPNSEWFELTSGIKDLDDQDQVRKFLQRETTEMHNMINNSNFQTEVHELYLDICSLGISPMSIEEDETMVVRFNTRFMGNVYAAENSRGVIDEIYVEFKWTARQLVQEYGLDVLPRKVQEAFKADKNETFVLYHCITPKKYDKTAGRPLQPYEQKHILLCDRICIKEENFNEFPYVVPRWGKSPGEAYGRSPAMNALAEILVLNEMVATTLEGAQKVVDPPLQAPDDGFVAQVNSFPGGITYYRAGTQDRVAPIFNDARIDFGFQAIQEKQTKIRDAFYVNQLQLGEGPQMTATEVMQRTEEKMRLLGPMLGRMQIEFLRPLIDRLWNIRMRRGLVKDIPNALRGRKIDVRYSSFIAKTQRQGEAQNVLRTLQAASPFFTLDPRAANLIDAKEAVKILARSYGFPQSAIRDADAVAAMEKQQAEAAAQAQKSQKDLATAEAAGKMAPVATALQGGR